MSDRSDRDLFLEQAREDAEGNEILERPERGPSLEVEREEAQGVEVFENPDATIPAGPLKEGHAGEETLTGEGLGLGREDGDDREGRSDDAG